MDNLDEVAKMLEKLGPSQYATTLSRERPYDGQPWTDLGERGKQLISGLTLRDLRDCYIRGCYLASGLDESEYPKSIYELPWDDMDPVAVWQNTSCEVERCMGIFPNVPEGIDVWDHIPVLDLNAP